MNHLHFDCFSGASGDMVLGALIDAGIPVALIREAIDSLGLPITLEATKVKSCGIAATRVTVKAEDEESHRYLPDIEAILAKGSLTSTQRDLAMRMFRIVAEAEAAVHGIAIDKVHFHEVGALDSIADMVGAAVGLLHLAPDRVTCSPVVVGSGTVTCAHGIMPVPAPATAAILQGVPIAPTTAKGELCTPTGAAILKAMATEFVTTPTMTIRKVGYGAGTKDLIDRPNLLRLLLGESNAIAETITELETDLDDCPGEWLGYAAERLSEAGAVDVSFTPIQMKKRRPGIRMTVLVPTAKSMECERILFRETGTFGLRKRTVERVTLAREAIIVSTHLGPVQAKRGRRDGIDIITPEFEDCARIARERGIPLRDVYLAVNSASSSLAE